MTSDFGESRRHLLHSASWKGAGLLRSLAIYHARHAAATARYVASFGTDDEKALNAEQFRWQGFCTARERSGGSLGALDY
jgi:hypothetical protein